MSTTIITDETVTITLRMGGTLTLASIDGGTAETVYTIPGESEETDELSGTAPTFYGPYPFGMSFAITATGSVQATTDFATQTGYAITQRLDSLPDAGEPFVLYQTADAMYWWDGSTFLPLGASGSAVITGGTIDDTVIGGDTPAAGTFTTLDATGLVRVTNGVGINLYRGGAGPILKRDGGTGNVTVSGLAGADFEITDGGLQFGTVSAIGAETVTGYISIKDSNGDPVKLAVVS